jgi:antitoxin (DNA-binding transcriptional repressor) of toxin-antitoxin stability system
MKSATIFELREGLLEYLERVRKGETVIVFDGDTPIARIEPPTRVDESLPEWVRKGLRRGVVTPPKIRDAAPLQPPVKIDPKFSVLEALLEERRSGW